MQTTNNRDDGGEWNCVGKKGKSKAGTSNTQGPDNQTSNKKVKRQSLKNGRTLSFQEFQQTGAQNEAAFQQAEGDHMAIGIGRLVIVYSIPKQVRVKRCRIINFMDDVHLTSN